LDSIEECRCFLELAVRFAEVPFDGPPSHAEIRSDRLDGSALRDQEHDAFLDRAQLGYGHGAPLVDPTKMRDGADVSLTSP
jgi:hypothetical protein